MGGVLSLALMQPFALLRLFRGRLVIGPLYLGLLNPDSRPLEGVKTAETALNGSEGRALPDLLQAPRRGLCCPQGLYGLGGLADLRRIRPALRARLPARGLPPHPFGASGTCCRDRLPKPRASRDAAADSIWVCCFPKNCLAVKGRSQGPARGRSSTVGRDRARTGAKPNP